MVIRDNKGRFTSELIGSNNYNWKGGLVELSCSYCGNTLYRYPHRLNKNKNHFCNVKCKGVWQHTNNGGENSPLWKGGRIVDKTGYVQVRVSNHHRRSHNGYVREHILVAEEKYGREIGVNEHIHHLNGIKDDNRPGNLLLTTNSKHDKFSYIHGLQERIKELELQLRPNT
jgi:hypothetical protein